MGVSPRKRRNIYLTPEEIKLKNRKTNCVEDTLEREDIMTINDSFSVEMN